MGLAGAPCHRRCRCAASWKLGTQAVKGPLHMARLANLAAAHGRKKVPTLQLGSFTLTQNSKLVPAQLLQFLR